MMKIEDVRVYYEDGTIKYSSVGKAREALRKRGFKMIEHEDMFYGTYFFGIKELWGKPGQCAELLVLI